MPWETDKEPPPDELILAEVTTSVTEYWVCTVDEHGTLVDAYGDDLGWQYESMDRWILFDEVLSAIGPKEVG
jgi:hypothetical protein